MNTLFVEVVWMSHVGKCTKITGGEQCDKDALL